jgi:hypothetical protein
LRWSENVDQCRLTFFLFLALDPRKQVTITCTSNSFDVAARPRLQIADSVRDPHASRLCDLLPDGVVQLEIVEDRARRVPPR